MQWQLVKVLARRDKRALVRWLMIVLYSDKFTVLIVPQLAVLILRERRHLPNPACLRVRMPCLAIKEHDIGFILTD